MTKAAPHPIDLYEAASQAMLSTMTGVTTAQLSDPTPCTEWNVRQLINHNLKVSQWAINMLTGGPALNPMDVDDELPREGAAAGFEAISGGLLAEAKSRPMDEQIPAHFGPITLGQLLTVNTGDVVIHKWDLAKATGQDATLDSVLAEVCYQAILPFAAPGREQGMFGPEVAVPPDARIQDKLLAVTGRRP